MPILHLSFKKNPGGGILLHGFLSPNEAAAKKMQEAHAGVCPSYGPEFRAGNTFEHVIEMEEIPSFEEQSIADWVDETFGLEEEDDEETGETEDDEAEEEEEDEESLEDA